MRTAILDPQAQTVEGYDFVMMPNLRLSATEVEAVVDYIGSLSDQAGGS